MDLASSISAPRPGRRFADLDRAKLLRSWRLFVSFNVLGLVTETIAALGFFILLQRDDRIVGSTEPFEPTDIISITAITLVVLPGFLALQLYIMRSIVDLYIIPYLPDEFFIGASSRRGPIKEPSRTPSLKQCASLLRCIRAWRTMMAWSVVVAYLLWVLVVRTFFADQMPLVLMFWVFVTGLVMSRLYYWRLAAFDPIPLIFGTPEFGGGTEQAIRRAFKNGDREQLERMREGFGYAKQVTRLHVATVWLLRLFRILPKPDSGAKRRRDDGARGRHCEINKALTTHHLQVLSHFGLLLALLVYIIGQIADSDAPNPLLDTRYIAAGYIAIAFLSAVLMNLYRTILHMVPRDPDSVEDRMCAEAFGALSRHEAQRESDAYIGRIDEKTHLYRHWCFEQRLVHAAIEHCEGIGKPMAVVFLDLDNFKAANLLWTHVYCDYLLWFAARAMERSVRQQDAIYRYGGEEFAMLLPGLDVDGAVAVAERVQREIRDSVRVARRKGRLFIELDDLRVEIPVQPSARDLAAVQQLAAEGQLAAANLEAFERLLSGEDGVVWALTVSAGVSDLSLIRPFGRATQVNGSAASDQTHRRTYDRYRIVYDRLTSAVSRCATYSKQEGRDAISYTRGQGGSIRLAS